MLRCSVASGRSDGGAGIVFLRASQAIGVSPKHIFRRRSSPKAIAGREKAVSLLTILYSIQLEKGSLHND